MKIFATTFAILVVLAVSVIGVLYYARDAVKYDQEAVLIVDYVIGDLKIYGIMDETPRRSAERLDATVFITKSMFDRLEPPLSRFWWHYKLGNALDECKESAERAKIVNSRSALDDTVLLCADRFLALKAAVK